MRNNGKATRINQSSIIYDQAKQKAEYQRDHRRSMDMPDERVNHADLFVEDATYFSPQMTPSHKMSSNDQTLTAYQSNYPTADDSR